TDLVRIRNGEVCYWPNLGYGRFGAKVTMDNAPWFEAPDLFDQRRIRLADIDGSGVTDIIYLGHNGVRLYFNQSGNAWSQPTKLQVFPHVDNLSSVQVADLLGNGTACLVWSSPLPGDTRRPMRYLDLMGGQKPHLLVTTVNNLGAETHVQYAPSTKFYLADKLAGKAWITKIPFPVHVVERVETHDHISGNRFVTCYAYHHGYFDGPEREFRGFGMVEQWDTEQFSSLAPIEGEGWGEGEITNLDAASHVPPVLTKTWFHTGGHLGRDHVSNFFAGLLDENDVGEYYREPAWRDDDSEARKHLLDDTVLPDGLTVEEEREACRALKGSMLRQEVYALDGTDQEKHPYTVTEQNFTIRLLQPQAGNRHAVFLTHARESLSYHYERNPADPRISHAVTLQVDEFGNVLRSLAIGYPRADVPERLPEQDETHLTVTLNRFANRADQADGHRVGLPVETRTYEVVKPPVAGQRFTWKELSDLVTVLSPLEKQEPALANTIPYEQWDWRKQWDPQTEPGGLVNGIPINTRLRLIEHVRTLYRKDNLTALLPLGELDPLALPGESYKLAFTPRLLVQVLQRNGQALLPNPADVLGGQGADRGGYLVSQDLKAAGRFPNTDPDDHWWIPSGQIFY
ncbi:MAG: toxin TcdB middle/C-terminal domain-containing protein, partial [Gammaproteobacteria bacterium]